VQAALLRASEVYIFHPNEIVGIGDRPEKCMHEATVAASLIGIVERAAAGLKGAKVVKVEVSIGRLKAVEPALLTSCFAFMAENTICDGAELVCTSLPVVARCGACNDVFEVKAFDFHCPACASQALTVESGRELRVDRILAR
jgi:hydrogenase nickel incorporation protein HypA/HybF